MKGFPKLIIISMAIVVAVISYCFFAGWFNIIPWTIFALLTGYLSPGRKETIFNGALFGYFLFLVYIILGYKGTPDSTRVLKFILFTGSFSLVGAIAGIIGGLIGNLLKN